MKPNRISKGIALLFLWTRRYMGMGCQRYAPVTLPPGKKSDTQGGWVGPRADLDGCVKSRPPPGFDSLTVQSVAMTCSYIHKLLWRTVSRLQFCVTLLQIQTDRHKTLHHNLSHKQNDQPRRCNWKYQVSCLQKNVFLYYIIICKHKN
jgi:hypothetical protein